jgi:CopG family transcriptional regulator/antitoxin EndoAI
LKTEKGGLIALSQIKKSDKNKLVAELEKGYKEMADINLELAQMCFEADNESLSLCEEKLTECE